MKAMKILSNLITGLLIVMLITTIALTFSAKRNGGTPKIFGSEIMSVLSGSMEPKIQTGSVIIINPVKERKNLVKGDVITFRDQEDGKKLITHRIVEIKKKDNEVNYITKGDSNKVNDPKPIPSSNVIGKYSGFTVPYVGYISDLAKTKTGAIYMLIIPGAVLIIWQLVSVGLAIVKLESEEKEKNAAGMKVG